MCCLKRIETLQVDGNGVKCRPRKRWREVLREDRERRYFVGKMLGTGQGGGECCGKAIGEVDPSTLGKNLVKINVFVVVVEVEAKILTIQACQNVAQSGVLF